MQNQTLHLYRIDYSIEVMKNGIQLEKRDIARKDHYTFGRVPGSDFFLEHPSASRLHAVIQYKASGIQTQTGF